MKIGQFEYKVLIEVVFTKEELAILKDCMEHHYDAAVKSAAKQGGFFYGWMNRIEIVGQSISCTADQLDTCAKAIEMPTVVNESGLTQWARFSLQGNLRNLLNSLGAEWERINKDSEGDSLRQLIAMYQGEGDDEFPEEIEYKRLAKISGGKRTPEQTKRLRELAVLIRELCEIRDSLSVEMLRARLAERKADGKG